MIGLEALGDAEVVVFTLCVRFAHNVRSGDCEEAPDEWVAIEHIARRLRVSLEEVMEN